MDMWHIPNSYGLWFMEFWRLGGKGSQTDWLTESINDKGVCRTASATPSLLIIWQTSSYPLTEYPCVHINSEHINNNH